MKAPTPMKLNPPLGGLVEGKHAYWSRSKRDTLERLTISRSTK
jgi:hypothetical protein